MMLDEGPRQIFVYETTLSVQLETFTVYHIIISTSKSTVSLIRYPFDFLEFHQKVRFYYPRSKLKFPALAPKYPQEPKKSLLKLLPFSSRRKTNARKIEKYLEQCFNHPVVGISSILRDFTSVQRDEDSILTSQLTSATLIPTETQIKTEPSEELRVQTDRNSLDDIELIKVVGKGCMGKVLLVRSKNQLYALKSIKKKWVLEQKELTHIKTERDILVTLRNQPFIVNLNRVFQTPSELFFLLDYYAGGDLATQLANTSRFSKERTKFYAAEILQGLEVLHRNNIIYRDLKPENILIGRDGHIALTDFGLSKILTEDDVDEFDVPSTWTFCGTAEYLAPEVILGDSYTYVVDFWSLGTLLYEMLAGTTPFWADNHMDMYQRVIEDTLEFPAHFDPITIDFLTGLLEKEPYERLGWGENGIQEIKSHPYFENMDWKQVQQRKLIPPHFPILASETDFSNFDELFTNLPVQISQSSAVDESKGFVPGKDPFEGFSFDVLSTNENIRKRNSDAILTLTKDGQRVIKKRQITATISTAIL